MSIPFYRPQPQPSGDVYVRVSDGPDGPIINRYVLVPGKFTDAATFVDTDISAEPQEVKDAVAEAWTADVVTAFKAAFPWVEPPPPPYLDLNRSAFLFMMNKIGVTEAAVEALIDKMPDGTPEQADAKTLALIVFRNQQTFARGNQLLQMLTAAAGLTSEAVDAAWRAAERIKW